MSYGQTYIVKTTGSDLRTETSRQAFSQIGSSCYSGDITLSLRHAFCDVTLKDIPSLIHEVQQQQSGLQYLCEASKIPVSSSFYLALNEFEWARNFVVTEATSPSISNQIAKLRDKLPWLDNDESRVYFELVGDTANKFADILFIASKAYTQGMCFISLYFEGVIYVTLEDITSDTQPLLGISFPDISGSSGDGATLALYENEGPWMKLSVWEVQTSSEQQEESKQAAEKPGSLSSDSYFQTYIILKGKCKGSSGGMRDVMFMFNNWCYYGQVELMSKINMADIPYALPALRIQQSKLKYVSDITSLPSASLFAEAMEHASEKQLTMQSLAADSRTHLEDLLHSTSARQYSWLEDETKSTFFKFACCDKTNILDNIELLAVKSYNPSGIISISFYYSGSWYLVLDEGGDDLPLLDSTFPDISNRGSSYVIQNSPTGVDGWNELRQMSICCNQITSQVSNQSIPTSAEVNRLEKKLEEVGSCCEPDSDEEAAWDVDGKPRAGPHHSDCEESSSGSCKDDAIAEKDSPDIVDEEGDIYAQLDRLDLMLNNELEGLAPLLNNDAPT